MATVQPYGLLFAGCVYTWHGAKDKSALEQELHVAYMEDVRHEREGSRKVWAPCGVRRTHTCGRTVH